MLKKPMIIILFSLVLMGTLTYRIFSSKNNIEMVSDLQRVLPIIDSLQYPNVETATFALGCFWGADGLFGSVPGVIRTRVGYTGGTVENPSYNSIDGHTEAVQMEYDPVQVSFVELLEIFWTNHSPDYPPWSQQYKSAIFFHSDEQKHLAYESKSEREKLMNKTLYTEIRPITEFYLAEGYHQKYRLQHEKELMREFAAMYPDINDFTDSTSASRVNGYVSGYGDLDNIQEELNSLGLSEAGGERLLELFDENSNKRFC